MGRRRATKEPRVGHFSATTGKNNCKESVCCETEKVKEAHVHSRTSVHMPPKQRKEIKTSSRLKISVSIKLVLSKSS